MFRKASGRWRIILIMLSLLYLFFLMDPAYSGETAGKIPENITDFRMEMIKSNDQKGITEKYVIRKEAGDYRIFVYNRDMKKELNPDFRFSRKLDRTEILQLISLMNYIDFLNMPDSIHNNAIYITSNPGTSFTVEYKTGGKQCKKRVLVLYLEIDYSCQEEMYKLSYLKYYILSMAYSELPSNNARKK